MRAKVNIIIGDCRQVLRSFPDGYFHCCVTSPPYWGLRHYRLPPLIWGGEGDCEHEWGDTLKRRQVGGQLKGYSSQWQLPSREAHHGGTAGQFCQKCGAWRGQLGLEPSPELYVEHLVEVFREVHRVLHPSGTLWLNLGHTYMGSGQGWQKEDSSSWRRQWLDEFEEARRQAPTLIRHSHFKPKDLVPIPWMVGMALQREGWWLRSDIIWLKINALPESVKDRPTLAHEYLLLLSKSRRYYYDSVAIREPAKEVSIERLKRGVGVHKYTEGAPGQKPHTIHRPRKKNPARLVPTMRNKRTVWSLAVQPFKGAHFAVFPASLVRPPILAGTSERGCCPKCGSPWERLVRKAYSQYEETVTIGWSPTCDCGEEPVPCRVLDPFAGTGTTGLVAAKLFRDSVLIELSPEYGRMAEERLRRELGGLFTEIEIKTFRKEEI